MRKVKRALQLFGTTDRLSQGFYKSGACAWRVRKRALDEVHVSIINALKFCRRLFCGSDEGRSSYQYRALFFVKLANTRAVDVGQLCIPLGAWWGVQRQLRNKVERGGGQMQYPVFENPFGWWPLHYR